VRQPPVQNVSFQDRQLASATSAYGSQADGQHRGHADPIMVVQRISSASNNLPLVHRCKRWTSSAMGATTASPTTGVGRSIVSDFVLDWRSGRCDCSAEQRARRRSEKEGRVDRDPQPQNDDEGCRGPADQHLPADRMRRRKAGRPLPPASIKLASGPTQPKGSCLAAAQSEHSR
jgi:hypothetical protein